MRYDKYIVINEMIFTDFNANKTSDMLTYKKIIVIGIPEILYYHGCEFFCTKANGETVFGPNVIL